MIIEGNGHDEWNGQPEMGTVSMKEGKMGMEVENGAGWRWPCAWGFMHASIKWMWWLEREKVEGGSQMGKERHEGRRAGEKGQ